MRLATVVLACLAVFALSRPADAQAVRFDFVSSTTNSACAAGALCPILAVPGATANVCASPTPANFAACLASPATTYTSSSAGTPCSSIAQLTPMLGGACVATSDNQGNFGWWISPGLYSYYLTIPASAGGGTYGPYPITVGGSVGCPLGVTCDANYATLALACTAAGSGTLYVTKAWTGLATASYSCRMQFLSLGKLQPAANQTVTLAGTVSAPAEQQIFDATTNSGAIIALTSGIPTIYSQWWGGTSVGFVKACYTAVNAAIQPVLVINASLTAIASATCPILSFTASGELQPASGQTITLNGVIASANQQILDMSAGGSLSGLGSSLGGNPIPLQWFGATSAGFGYACTAAGGGYTILVGPGTVSSMTTQSCAANIQLGGGVLQTASMQTLTLTGAIIAPVAVQIFDTTSNGGAIALSKACCTAIYPQWWGAVEDGSTADTTPIAAALTAGCSYGLPVYFLPGNYRSATINFACTTALTFGGAGSGSTTISTTTASIDLLYAIAGSGQPVYNINGLKLVGPDGTCGSTTSGNGLRISGGAAALLRIHDIVATGFCGIGKSGIWLGGPENGSVTDVISNYNDTGLLVNGSTNAMSFSDIAVSQNNSYGCQLAAIASDTFINLAVQSNVKFGCVLSGLVVGVSFVACHFENNNTSATASTYGLELNGTTAIENSSFRDCSWAGTYENIFLTGSVRNCDFSGNIGSGAASNPITEDGGSISSNTWHITTVSAFNYTNTQTQSDYIFPFTSSTNNPAYGIAATIQEGRPPNFIPQASETGSNNAIAGCPAQALPTLAGVVGYEVTIVLAHSLQAGANTYSYCGLGAQTLANQYGNNLVTAFTTGLMVHLWWNGAEWLALGAT